MTDAPEKSEKSSDKSPTNLWAELGPTIAFILTYTVMGRFLPEGDGAFTSDAAIFWATGALMASTAVVIVYKLMNKEKIPPMLILSGSVVGFFGVLTIALQQEAFAYIKPKAAKPNTVLSVTIHGKPRAGRVLSEAAYDPQNLKPRTEK